MQTTPKISIIIPCYNAASYVSPLLEALSRQAAGKPVEIIVINDGSTDDTLSILNNYHAQQPSLFHIVTKENGGTPPARNLGFSLAKGEYIWYVDGDDLITDGAIDALLAHISHTTADVICFNYREMDQNGHLLNSLKDWHYTYGSKIDTITAYALFDIPSYLWNRLIRRDYLLSHHITFPGLFPDDEEYVIQTYYAKGSMQFVPDVIYQYRIVTASHSRKVKTFIIYCDNYKTIIERLIAESALIDSKPFCTKLLFNCIKNKLINNNRVRIAEPHALPYGRKAVYHTDHDYITRMRSHITFRGKYGRLLWVAYRLPWVLDAIVYLRYKLLKWT